MIKQNIFIINYNSLYEILEEIKDNLPFKIIEYQKEEDFIVENQSNINDTLIILKSNQKLPKNKNLNKTNFLRLPDLPLSIYKLTELINIQLIKLKFNYQSKISVKNYELDLNSKFISKNDVGLKLNYLLKKI